MLSRADCLQSTGFYCSFLRFRRFPTQGEFQMTNKEENVELVNDLIEIQELESKVAPNIVWST